MMAANGTNSITYIYKLVDNFSNPLKNINKLLTSFDGTMSSNVSASDNLKKAVTDQASAACRSFVRMNGSIETVTEAQNELKKVALEQAKSAIKGCSTASSALLKTGANAIKLNGVQLKVTQSVNETASAFRKLQISASKAYGKIKSSAGAAKESIKKSIGDSGLAGMAVGASIGAMVSKNALDQYLEQDREIARTLSIMSGDSADNKRQMIEVAYALSEKLPIDANSAISSLYDLTSAGLDANNAMKALPFVSEFATAGMTDVQEATELLMTAQSALGMKSNDPTENLANMKEIANKIAKASNIASESTAGFTKMLVTKSAAQMATAGVGLDEGLATLSALAEAGFKGERGGEAFNALMNSMSKYTQNKEAFKITGIKIFDEKGERQSIQNIIRDYAKALSGKSDKDKMTILQSLGLDQTGEEAIKGLMLQLDNMEKFKNEIANSDGTVSRMADTVLSSDWSQWEIMINNIKNTTVDLVASVSPAIRLFAQSVSWGAKALQKMPAPIKWLIAGFGGIFTAITMVGTAYMILKATMVIPALGWIKDVILKNLLWDKVIKKVIFSQNGAVRVTGLWGKSIKWLSSLKTKVIARIKSFNLVTLAHTAAAKTAAFAARIWGGAIKSIGWIKQTAAMLAHKTAMLAISVATKAVTAVTWLWNAAQGALNVVLTANPIGIVIAAVGVLSYGIYKLVQWFRECYTETGSVWGALGVMYEKSKKVLSVIAPFIVGIVELVKWFRECYRETGSVWGALKLMGNGIYEHVAKPFEWVAEKISGFVDWIGKVTGISDSFVEVIKEFGESIQNWLIDKFDWVINKAKDFLGWLGKIANSVNDWFGGNDSSVEVNRNSTTSTELTNSDIANTPGYIQPYADNYSQKTADIQTLIHNFTGKIVVAATGDSKVVSAQINLPKGMNMAHISG